MIAVSFFFDIRTFLSDFNNYGFLFHFPPNHTAPEKNESTFLDFELPSGVTVWPNFVTPAEEERLINLIQWDDDTTTTDSKLKHRQVKHFGYKFRYDTNNVDADQPLVNDKIPSECDFLWVKQSGENTIARFAKEPHQLTINKYEPGQGE